MTQPGEQVGTLLADLQKEVREIRRDLYGNPQVRQKGVYDRLETLEENLQNLRTQYEAERVETGALGKLEDRMDMLDLNYRIAIVYLKGIAGAVGTITVALLVASVVGILRVFAGG